LNFVVSARVAFKPTYQSASERATAEAYKFSYFFPGWSFLNPSRIALSVTDDIHNRFIGFFTCALSRIQRATNSPSLPASVAITTSVTSSLFNCVLIVFLFLESPLFSTWTVALAIDPYATPGAVGHTFPG